MTELVHLARRFLFSLRPGMVDADRERWLLDQLGPAELELYRAQSRADRVHSLRCAEAIAAEGGDPELVVASALHDVGKARARLGTWARVGATVLARLIGDGKVRGWEGRGDWRGRIGSYVDHDRHGAALLEAAGSGALTVAWARDHHRGASPDIDDATFARLHRADHS